MTYKTFKMSRKSNNKRNLIIGRILILEQSIRDKVRGGLSRKHGISNAGLQSTMKGQVPRFLWIQLDFKQV